MPKGSTFTTDYKKEIVRLVTELDKDSKDVASDIGVTTRTVRRWVKEFDVHGTDSFPGKGKLHPVDEEKKKLQKETQSIKEENAILKKAMSIFAKDGK